MYMKTFKFYAGIALGGSLEEYRKQDVEAFDSINEWIRENNHRYKAMNISRPVYVEYGTIQFFLISVVYVER
jgi:hypothetical protein